MAEKADQLPLHLPLEAAQDREDLVVSSANANAVAFLDSWPDWETPIAILAGPVGAGKTHLARVWATRADASFVDAEATQPDFDVTNPGHVVVENLAQGSFSEAWLFHLINGVRSAGSSLLLTSRKWPGEWGVSLPDLQSRLKTAHLMELGEPDDHLLAGVLVKLFSDRQLNVDQSVIDYLVLRMERSLASAQTLVDHLDELSLVQKRAVTRPLAAEALRQQGIAAG